MAVADLAGFDDAVEGAAFAFSLTLTLTFAFAFSLTLTFAFSLSLALAFSLAFALAFAFSFAFSFARLHADLVVAAGAHAGAVVGGGTADGQGLRAGADGQAHPRARAKVRADPCLSWPRWRCCRVDHVSAPEFNDWDLTALSPLPAWVLGAAAGVLLLALAMSWQSSRGGPLRLRVALLLLRASLLGLVFVALLEPGRRLLQTSREPDRVVVAVDTSASMAVGEGQAQRSRVAAAAAKRILEDLKSREPAVAAELWFFDSDVRGAPVDELDAMASGARVSQGKTSLISGPIVRADNADGVSGVGNDGDGGDDVTSAPDAAGLPLGALIIISDGADTGGLGPALSAELRERAGRLGAPRSGDADVRAPIHTVAIGSDAAFKDVAIERVVADEFAFVRNQVKVDVVLRQRGFSGSRVPITLAEDGVVVARTELTLVDNATAGDELRATMTFSPQRAGKRLYTVSVPVLDGEAIAENNRVDFTMKLIRDRIRVLQVAGRPSWDERFVRRLLKENPSVDLISFFILRSPSDISGAPNSELSLIPFPTRELFTEQLSTFDVVIFQDFNYRPYNMGIYLQNVADYVKGGGGFLMMGGDLSFSEGDYAGTPIEGVLPVRLLAGHGHTSTDDFSPTVTDVGRRHPITDVSGTVRDAAAADPFSALPPLQGINKTGGLVPGATALLTHPFENGPDGSPQPVIAVADIDKGRSVAIMTDSTWHWSLPQVGQGAGRSDAHRKLLANTLRWLIRDPELSRVKLNLDADARGVEPGAPVSADVRVQDALYQPLEGAQVKIELIPLDSDARGDGIAPVANATDDDAIVTGKDGSARVVVHPDRTGAWRVKATVSKDGAIIGSDEDVFVVRKASLERLFAEARPEVLGAIAAAAGGRAVGPDDVTGLTVVDHQRTRIQRQKTEPIWNTWVTLAAIAGLAVVEWWWRRRRGFA